AFPFLCKLKNSKVLKMVHQSHSTNSLVTTWYLPFVEPFALGSTPSARSIMVPASLLCRAGDSTSGTRINITGLKHYILHSWEKSILEAIPHQIKVKPGPDREPYHPSENNIGRRLHTSKWLLYGQGKVATRRALRAARNHQIRQRAVGRQLRQSDSARALPPS